MKEDNEVEIAKLLAKMAFPEMNDETRVYKMPASVSTYRIPLARSFEQESIEIKMFAVKLRVGYSPKTNTLVIGVPEIGEVTYKA